MLPHVMRDVDAERPEAVAVSALRAPRPDVVVLERIVVADLVRDEPALVPPTLAGAEAPELRLVSLITSCVASWSWDIPLAGVL